MKLNQLVVKCNIQKLKKIKEKELIEKRSER